MENIRPLKELLQVFLDNQDLFERGLCRWVMKLREEGLIKREEEDCIDRLIEEDLGFNLLIYQWEKGIIEYRIDWLKENLK